MKSIRVLFLLLLLVGVFAISGFADGKIYVGTDYGMQGDTVQIPVVLTNNSGFASLGIEITYDAKVLSLTDVVNNSEIAATFMTSQSLTANPYHLSWNCTENNTFCGTLVTLSFTVLTDAPGQYPISVSFYKGRDGNYTDGYDVNYDEDFEALSLSYIDGSVTVVANDCTAVQINIGHQRIVLVAEGKTVSGTVLVACYDAEGRMCGLKSFAADGIALDFTPAESANVIAALWWSGVTELCPRAQRGMVVIR